MEFRLHVNTVIERDGQILLVQEAKQKNYGKWNLPGGHLEVGEKISDAALREILEETYLEVELEAFLGVYTTVNNHHSICFAFFAKPITGEPKPGLPDVATAKPGDNILSVRWLTPEEIAAIPDDQLVNPAKLRKVFKDFAAGKRLSLDVISEDIKLKLE